MKLIKGLVGFILLLVLVGIGVGGYFGLIPGVSHLFGSNKARNLGVKYTQADFDSVVAKGGAERTVMASSEANAQGILYEGATKINQSFTSSELTALTNKYDRWINNPFSNIQIKITGNSAEVAGVVSMKTMFALIKSLGFSQTQIDEAMTTYKIPYADIPFYVNGQASILNNKGSMSLSKVELGRVPVPQALVTQYQGEVTGMVMNALLKVPNIDIKKATFENGQMMVDGTFPNKQKTVTTTGAILAK